VRRRGISPALQRRLKRRVHFSGSALGGIGCGGEVGVCAFKIGPARFFADDRNSEINP
jgi:hypothetical protein